MLGAGIRYELIFFFFRKGSIFVIFELIIKALTVESAVLTSLVEGFRELEEQDILPWPLDIEEDIQLEGEVEAGSWNCWRNFQLKMKDKAVIYSHINMFACFLRIRSPFSTDFMKFCKDYF